MRHTLGALQVVFAVLAVTASAWAGRESPGPITRQLEDGFGIVAVEVVSAQLIPDDQNYPTRYTVKLKVQSVAAQPVGKDPLKLAAGDVFEMELHVGYGCTIEDWGTEGEGGGPNAGRAGGPLAPGARWLLSIRPAEKGGYEPAPGCSADWQHVKEFAPATLADIARLREMAALDAPKKLAAYRQTVADAKASDFLRGQVLQTLWHRVWPTPPDNVERVETAKALLATWNDPTSNLSDALLNSLDGVLRQFSVDFAASTDRERVWMKRIFAPFPRDPKAIDAAVHERDAVVYVLRDFAEVRPEKTAKLLMDSIRDAHLPAQFRWRLAGFLQGMYQNAEQPVADWDAALQQYFPAAIDEASPWMLRLISTNFEWLAKEPAPNQKRRLTPAPAIREALVRARGRMEQMQARGEGAGEPASAISEIDEAMKAIAAAAKATSRPN